MTEDRLIGKLVRDRIPEILRKEGGDPLVSVLTVDEYECALLVKLREETDELAEAPEGSVREELADVLEVLRAIAAVHALDWAAVEATRSDKRIERGGFDEHLWLAGQWQGSVPRAALRRTP